MLVLLAVGLIGSVGLWFTDAPWLRTALEVTGFVCAAAFLVSATLEGLRSRARK